MTPHQDSPLKGLLLVGGKSSRMGKDKSDLVYQDGLTARERGAALLRSVCSQVYFSQREGAGDGVISDAYGEIGPMGAIASAMDMDPEAAWLVMACDLPLVTTETLKLLVRERQDSATAFRGHFKGWPEPLCAIYEPAMKKKVLAAIQAEDYCPRHLLEGTAHLVPLPFPSALDNANTPEEFERIQAILNTGFKKEKRAQIYHLTFFAKLRDEVGVSELSLESSACNPAQLFEELRETYSISLRTDMIQVAVNDAFAAWSTDLHHEDRIVFMPPMSGG